MSSPFLVSTVMTDPSESCRRTIGIPTRLFPTTDILYYEAIEMVIYSYSGCVRL